MHFDKNQSNFTPFNSDKSQKIFNQQSNSDKNSKSNMLSQANQNKNKPLRNMSEDNIYSNQSQNYYCIQCNQKYNGHISCSHINNQNFKNQEEKNNSHNKTYKCSYDDCQKQFNLESSLSRHKVIHTGQRPYTCDYESCSQKFNQKSNLNRHKKIHKNQKPFICQKCCKKFTTTTNLKQHSQVHIQKKQQRKIFVCQVEGCQKQYLYRCNLKKHKIEHQDPVTGCIEKNKKQIDQALFQISIGDTRITVGLKDKFKNHTQVRIGYENNENNDFKYDEQQNQEHIQVEQTREKVQQKYRSVLERIFSNLKQTISISFSLHPNLLQNLQTLMSEIVQISEFKSIKIINFIANDRLTFTKAIQIILQTYFDYQIN